VGQSYSGPDYEGISFALASDRPRLGGGYRTNDRPTGGEPKIRSQNDVGTHSIYVHTIVITIISSLYVVLFPRIHNTDDDQFISRYLYINIRVSFRALVFRIYLTRRTAAPNFPSHRYPRVSLSTTLAYFSTTVAVVPENTAHRAFSPFSNIYIFVLARSHHYFLLYYIKNTITIIIIVCLYCIHDLRFVKHQSKTSISIYT
jgi:hypothetical protein